MAGNGNTSTACNQGDINNLNLKTINEVVLPEIKGENLIFSVKNDEFIHFTTDDNANKILSDNKLKSFEGSSVFAVSVIYGMFLPEVQSTHIKDGRVAAIKFKTNVAPKIGYTEEVVWNVDVPFTRVELIDFDTAVKILNHSNSVEQQKIKEYLKKNYNTFVTYIENKSNISETNVDTMTENKLLTLNDLPFKQEIEQLGGKIFSVGGAVRDEFLGKESKDLDVLITGIPMDQLETVLSKYGRVDAVGKSFGILKFKPEGSSEDIDIAIPRTERPTGDGGHKGFDVSSDHALPIEKDLERRDFTINAIAKDIDGNIVDPYNGREDLKNKIIKVVNPQAFADDPLRMLRAVQFASRFGFNIEPNTMKMIQDNSAKINEIPAERILTEFDKIVKRGDKRVGAQLLKDTGLYKNIFGFDIKQSTIDRSPFEDVKSMGEFIFLLTRLLGNPADYYKNNLKGDIDTYKEIKALNFGFESDLNDQEMSPIKARSVVHNMYVIYPNSLNSEILPESIKIAANELLAGKYPKSFNELAVNGNDLIALGLNGKEIGDTLKKMLISVYSDKLSNDKNELLASLNNSTTLNESKYSDAKNGMLRSKTLSSEMKEKISKLMTGGSTYHEGGKVHGLMKPKGFTDKTNKSSGVSLGADKNGFYCYTHRARSHSYESPDKIPVKDIEFIESTG